MDKPKVTMVPVPKRKHGHRGKNSQQAIETEDRAEQIMNMLRSGMSQSMVAEELGITKQTVNKHFQRGMAILRDSIIDSRLDLLMLETEKLEAIRAAYTEPALLGDVQSAGVVVKIHEKIANLWGLNAKEVIDRLPSEQAHMVKDEDGANKPMIEVVRDHLDLRVIDTESELWSEVSPSVMRFLEDKSFEEHVEYIKALAIPFMQEAVVPIRKSLPDLTGAGDFKGIFTQAGANFVAVTNINGHDSMLIIDAINETRR